MNGLSLTLEKRRAERKQAVENADLEQLRNCFRLRRSLRFRMGVQRSILIGGVIAGTRIHFRSSPVGHPLDREPLGYREGPAQARR
jgi:hypothetical protein